MTKKFTCDATDCGFEVRAGTREEVVQYAQQHAEQHHDAELAERDATEMIETL